VPTVPRRHPLEPPLPGLARRARPFRTAGAGELPALVGRADSGTPLDFFAGQLFVRSLCGNQGVVLGLVAVACTEAVADVAIARLDGLAAAEIHAEAEQIRSRR
jgi:hypothetical protein